MSEIQEEIERQLKEGDLIESIKNTLLGILNADEEHHHDMAEYCFQAIDRYKAESITMVEHERLVNQAKSELLNTLVHKIGVSEFYPVWQVEELEKIINSIRKEQGL